MLVRNTVFFPSSSISFSSRISDGLIFAMSFLKSPEALSMSLRENSESIRRCLRMTGQQETKMVLHHLRTEFPDGEIPPHSSL